MNFEINNLFNDDLVPFDLNPKKNIKNNNKKKSLEFMKTLVLKLY